MKKLTEQLQQAINDIERWEGIAYQKDDEVGNAVESIKDVVKKLSPYPYDEGDDYWTIVEIPTYEEYRITIYNDVQTPSTFYLKSKSSAKKSFDDFVSESQKGKLENTGIAFEGSNDDENLEGIDCHEKDCSTYAEGGEKQSIIKN